MIRQLSYCNDEVIEQIDQRTLQSARDERLAVVKTHYRDKILAAYPEHQQRNAAMGLLGEEETAAVTAGIQALRDEYAAHKAQLMACETLPELDACYLTLT